MQEAVPQQSSSLSRVESGPARTHVVVRSSPQCDSTPPRETFGHDLPIPEIRARRPEGACRGSAKERQPRTLDTSQTELLLATGGATIKRSIAMRPRSSR